jgi:hypothetical protein
MNSLVFPEARGKITFILFGHFKIITTIKTRHKEVRWGIVGSG